MEIDFNELPEQDGLAQKGINLERNAPTGQRERVHLIVWVKMQDSRAAMNAEARTAGIELLERALAALRGG